MIAAYLSVSFILGIVSNQLGRKWSWVIFFLIIFLGIVLNSLPYLDFKKESFLQLIIRVFTEGTFWYLIPSLVFGGLPFLASRYSYILATKNKKDRRGK
jgi:hypothetical protein